MNKMKKIASGVMAASLAAMSVVPISVMAAQNIDNTGEATVTIKDVKEGETYTLYQVMDLSYNGDAYYYQVNPAFVDFFKGIDEVHTETGKTWGEEYTASYDAQKFNAANKIAYAYLAASHVEGDANALDPMVATAIKEYINANPTKSYPTVVKEATSNEDISVAVSYGYWLMTPEDTTDGKIDDTSVVFAVNTAAPDVDISNKSFYPTIDKYIVNADGSVTDANTAGIGDDIDYRITSAVPKTDGYRTYQFTITDTIAEGLTPKDQNADSKFDAQDVQVKIGDSVKVAGTDYTVTVNGQVITIDFATDVMIKEATDSAITVSYTATLNEKANIGVEGNSNIAKLTFSNDPAQSADKEHMSTDETPEEEVKTYTGGFTLTKLDAQTRAALADAEFKLTPVGDSTLTNANIIDASHTEETGKGQGSAVEFVLKTGEDGVISVQGLKDGEYILTETSVPRGYIGLDEPIHIVIDSDAETMTDTNGANSADGRNAVYTVVAEGDNASVKSDEANVVDTISATEKGVYTFNVLNDKQSPLPNTGVVGGVAIVAVGLAAAAAGFGLSKGKKKTEED